MSFTTPLWDLQIFRLFNDTLRGPFLDAALPIMSYTPIVWALAVACIVGFICRNWGRMHRDWKRLACVVLVLGISVGVTDITCNIIKHEVNRARPHQALADVHYMTNGTWHKTPPLFVSKKHTSQTSFVSSHAANSMALTVCLLLLFPWTRPWLLTLPLFIGWSRLYLGKHYPLDILGGYAVGLLVGLMVWYGFVAVRTRWGSRFGME